MMKMQARIHRQEHLVTLVALVLAIAWTASPTAVQAATTATYVTNIPGSDVTLSGVIYKPDGFDTSTSTNFRGVVMLHGCTGIWSNRVVGTTNNDALHTPNLQNYEEKWGWKLAEKGIVALAIDSYEPRRAAGVDSASWQNQCSGATYGGQVNPYTTRVLDARSGHAYLVATGKVSATRVGMLGWSQGAQSVLTEAAATLRLTNSLRTDAKFVVSVAFYPGCGTDLEFRVPPGISNSYWRPEKGMRLNVGTGDGFFNDCQTRRNIAVASPYLKVVEFPTTYTDAPHNFDNQDQAWPSAHCASGDSPTLCAMKDADIDSLAFLEARL